MNVPSRITLAALALIPWIAAAQIITNDQPAPAASAETMSMVQAAPATTTTIDAAVNDPSANAADLGLATPGGTVDILSD